VVGIGYASDTGANRTVLPPLHVVVAEMRYSTEEIRFNLLAVAQRTLRVQQAHLQALQALEKTLVPHLDTLIPDWKALVEFVPATEAPISTESIEDTVKLSDANKLLAIERGLQRDMTLAKHKIHEEEDKLSGYAVTHLLPCEANLG
jgi:hypothetical protein